MALVPVSVSNSLSRVAGWVVVEIVEYLVLLVDGVEVVEELDLFALVLEEFNDLSAIVEIGPRDEVGEVGRRLEVDVRLEADEIHEELVDLSDPIVPVEGRYGEGSGGEGGNGGLSLNDDVEGGGHIVVVAAGKACDWCRTGF